jgi:hypothetical protein
MPLIFASTYLHWYRSQPQHKGPVIALTLSPVRAPRVLGRTLARPLRTRVWKPP